MPERAAATTKRSQTAGEEIANSVSHGVGLVAALAAVPVLVIAATRRGDAANVVGASVFAVTMVLVYLASTVYHALPRNRAKHVMRVVDHAAIFLLIAGTYTPFTLGVLRGPWGWTLLGLVWGLGLVGIAVKTLGGLRYPALSMGLYVTAGWAAIIAVKPLWIGLPSWGLFWLLAGGVAYTGGIAFYATDRVRYRHFVWHLCVLAGSACHFVAVWLYAG